MSEKAINDGQWNPWRLLQDAEFIIRDLSPDHDFPGRIRTAREAHDKAIASGTDPETAAEERGRLQGQFSPLGDNHHNAAACPHCGDLLTKAEERGRRRGVEERNELLRKLLAWADSAPVKAVTVSAWIHGVKFKPEDVAVWDEARAALAPRDSGKEGA